MATLRPDSRNHPPSAQDGGAQGAKKTPKQSGDWLDRARSAYTSSTTYVDANYRKTWEDAIRAFNGQHPNDSKYNNPAYEKRSRVYRPKIRAVMRKNEAAAAAAFFSNMDVVSIEAMDTSNTKEVASAEVNKQLLQYRLTKSVPWYQTVIGGLQDAQTTGVVCAHIYWKYREEPAETLEAEETGDVEEEDPEYPIQTDLPEGAFAVERSKEVPEGNSQTPSMLPQSGPIGIPPAALPGSAPPPASAPTAPGVAALPAQQGGMPPHAPGAPAPLPPVPPPPPVPAQPAGPKVLEDRPVVDLIPVENLRIDPGANWIDPINTSPYVIELVPMYVLDIKERMESGEWLMLSDGMIAAATEPLADSTRVSRNANRDDPYGSDNTAIDDYAIVWVQRHIHRRGGRDWSFYTLADLAMLTDPVPLEDIVFHGKRPYVLGNCILETHKLYPASLPTLSKGLLDETNEITNQRLDNVKFVLNKKFLVKRGKEADVGGLLRNVPGGVVMLDDPMNDVKELNWQDVTASAFQEQQGINMEMDELLGNFNPASLMAQGAANSPARNMAMLSQSNGTLVEYLLRTYVETFVQPVLRQLILLEQHYETDQVVIKIAAKRAQLFQKFGIDKVTDELLEQELTLTVNVGMGATDPHQKLQKFMGAMSSFSQMMQHPTPGINMVEVGKEIFGHLGYSDGSRFFTTENPQVAALTQQIQQMGQQLQQMQAKLKEKADGHQMSLQKTRETNQAGIVKVKIAEDAANKRALATHFRALTETKAGHEHQSRLALAGHIADMSKVAA
jgi:hypothetical protein